MDEKERQPALTPLMAQYQSIKAQHAGEVLFFRLGDFYEMFDSDAEEISRLLNLTLTHRAGHPMCGVPYHASRIYIARLLRLGKKIAVCEQLNLSENGKGLAERKVVEIITPGTAVEEDYLEQNAHNFLSAVCFASPKRSEVSFAYIDISTGAFYATHWQFSDTLEEFSKELGRVLPRELIISRSLYEHKDTAKILENFPFISINTEDDWRFDREAAYKQLLHQFGTVNLHSFSLADSSPEVPAAGCLVGYILRTSAVSRTDAKLPQITSLVPYKDSDFVVIDDSSRRNLELISNLHDGTIQYSLLETVQHTATAMGSRLLRSFFMHPLRNGNDIRRRQAHVALFVRNQPVLDNVHSVLSGILDVERLASRIVLEKAHAKDIQALRFSLNQWLKLREIFASFAPGDFSDALYVAETDTASDMINLIGNAILDDPSTVLTEGGIIKPQWSEELDRYRQLQTNFNQVLDEYLEEEKKRTGIANLKIRYNRIIGYYMEVSKGKLDAVPDHFILRRALVNGDRYTSERLQELEAELTVAGEKIIETEKRLFLEIRSKLAVHIRYLLNVAAEIAYIDVIASFAKAALLHNWVCPDMADDKVLEIEDGRHPVVQMHLPEGEFVPNNTSLSDGCFAVVTGPNMAGKSTYLRQNALIVFLAHIGSWVPARKAKIGLVDRIFCRVGASDNLARGQSTFLVEMSETALILRSASEHSLIIMDEVGRGTSTEDGLAIAWAVSEYLLNTVKARTFFATHYHELTRIRHNCLQLLCLDVRETDGHIVFTKKIHAGASENSYGLHVARLAGIPLQVIDRAQIILNGLQNKTPFALHKPNAAHSAADTPMGGEAENDEFIENENSPENPAERLTVKGAKADSVSASGIPALFSDEELVLDEILSCDPNTLTPLEALQALSRWHKSLCGK